MGLVWYFQFHAAVDNIGFQAVESLDFRIPRTISQVFHCNIPQGIAVDDGMDAVITAQPRRDLLGQVAHPGVHPAARTGFVGKPSMNRQHHLIRLWLIGESFTLVPKPQQLGFTVALADVCAQLNQPVIDHIVEGIRFGNIGCALNGDRPLYILTWIVHSTVLLSVKLFLSLRPTSL